VRPFSALLLPLLLAGGGAAAQGGCPTSPEGMSLPAEASPSDWVYTDAADRVLVSGAPSWVRHHALGGDDAVFLVAPPASATVAGGRGGDVITVCSLREPSLLLLAGDFEAMTGDGAADLVVIEPEVFLGVPDGVTLQIAVQGFTAAQDRILLRLPPGISPEFWPNPAIALRAGPVAIAVATVDDPMPVTAAAFRIEPAAPAWQPAWAAVSPPFASYDPALRCIDAPDAAAPPAREAPAYPPFKTPPLAFHDASDKPLRIEDEAETYVLTSDAPDRLLVFGGAVISGAGADLIVVCGIGEEFLTIAAGPGSVSGLDLDADTIVVDAGRLQGAPRTLSLVNLNPLNDRIVLRLPPGLEPSFERPQFGLPSVRVGTLTITTLAQVWERGLDYALDPAAFAVDRFPAP
jgi:hypothetical protein